MNRPRHEGNTEQFERIKISATTVLSWLIGLSTVTIWLGWTFLWFRIDALEDGGNRVEVQIYERIHNLEDHVVWRRRE